MAFLVLSLSWKVFLNQCSWADILRPRFPNTFF